MNGKIRGLTLIALLAAMPLAAQSRFGVVGGIVSSNLSTRIDGQAFEWSSLTGFAVGVSLRSELPGGTITFAPEALYIMKGAREERSGPDAKLKISYLEVPLLIRANIKTSSSSFKPFVLGGPSIAFKLSCKEVFDSESDNCSTEEVKSTDVGGMFGAGAAFGKIAVSIRYDLGFADISKVDGESVKNRVLMLMANFAF